MTLSRAIYALYDQVKGILSDLSIAVDPYQPISYGIQFQVFLLGRNSTIRLYESKKGLKIDLSQVKDERFNQQIADALLKAELPHGVLLNKPSEPAPKANPETASDPDDLIGIDESGKGDYFGPLVVAAVHVTPHTQPYLVELGVQDSKVMSDQKILAIESLIKEKCPHSLIVLQNQSYNEIYETMKNLNHILAWGHAKSLENTLKQASCQFALSDQFANPSLVKKALMAKGREITLLQRPRAESNIAVAAASILARAAFLQEMASLEDHFNMTLPRGCSDKTIRAAQKLVETHGKDALVSVAKLHFKVTQEVL